MPQALISLARSEDNDDTKVVQAVYGVVFFGVPHDGMDIGSLIPMVGDGLNRFIVESMSHINSQILTIQQREFVKAFGPEGNVDVVCFYETMASPTAQQVSVPIVCLSPPIGLTDPGRMKMATGP